MASYSVLQGLQGLQGRIVSTASCAPWSLRSSRLTRANKARGVSRDKAYLSGFPCFGAITGKPSMYTDCSDFRSDSGQMSSRPLRFGSPAASAFLLPGGWGPLWDGVRCGCGCGGEWKFAAWGRVPQWASGGGRSSFYSRRQSFPVRLSRHGPSLPGVCGACLRRVGRGRQAPFFCHLFLGGKKR